MDRCTLQSSRLAHAYRKWCNTIINRHLRKLACRKKTQTTKRLIAALDEAHGDIHAISQLRQFVYDLPETESHITQTWYHPNTWRWNCRARAAGSSMQSKCINTNSFVKIETVKSQIYMLCHTVIPARLRIIAL